MEERAQAAVEVELRSLLAGGRRWAHRLIGPDGEDEETGHAPRHAKTPATVGKRASALASTLDF
jgi:hypothetical protein